MDKQLSKTNTLRYNEDEVSFVSISLLDKIIINIQINGMMDTTIDIPLSTSVTVRQTLAGDANADDTGIEPSVLVGQVNNTKLEVVATQVGKLVFASANPKSIILTIGSRWFGKGNEHEPEDFDKLMFVLQGVKLVL